MKITRQPIGAPSLTLALLLVAGCTAPSDEYSSRPPRRAAATIEFSEPMSDGGHDPSSDGARNPFSPEDGSFQATLPAAPAHREESIDTPIGPQKIVRYVATTPEGEFDAGYLVRTSTALTRLAGDERILDGACRGTARQLGGTVRKSTPIEVDGHSGRDLEIELPEGRRASARLVITSDRIFHAIARPAIGCEPLSDGFVHSLRLTTPLRPTPSPRRGDPAPHTH